MMGLKGRDVGFAIASALVLVLGGVGAQAQIDSLIDPEQEKYFTNEIEPILEEFCYSCHGDNKQEGDLDIEGIIGGRPFVMNKEAWENVLARVQNKEMPPKDEKKQPSRRDFKDLGAFLDKAINQFDYSKVHNPGYEAAKRLTHNEFNNTMRDLFVVDIRPGDKFPLDLSGKSGFDNSANTLFMQPLLLERYIGAADDVVEAALPAVPETDAQKRAHEMIFITRPNHDTNQEEAARQVLDHFMDRAFRRPATVEEVDSIMRHFVDASRNGSNFEESIKRALKVVLVSPNFLIRIEHTSDSPEAFQINDWELASRLSFFLWGSMPDEELFALAASNTLHESEVLAAQVTRMMTDDKAQTLGNTFAAQWLGFDDLGTRIRLDPIDNPWCTDTLMASMRAETAMFFDSLLQENRSITELINAEYTFINEELANHYKMDGIEGEEMRRINLDNPNRGGILANGSVLAVTSAGRRTSPVMRGKWVLETILGTPPPPPPPDVDAGALDRDLRRNRSLSMREKLELHSAKPRCQGCHARLDPFGLSLENYDYFGRYRSRGRGGPIDSSAVLEDGTEFAGVGGLKMVIVEKRMDDLVRQVSQKMLSYALGRQLEWYDEPAIRDLVAALGENEYRFQTLIFEIATSYPFQQKRNQTSSVQ